MIGRRATSIAAMVSRHVADLPPAVSRCIGADPVVEYIDHVDDPIAFAIEAPSARRSGGQARHVLNVIGSEALPVLQQLDRLGRTLAERSLDVLFVPMSTELPELLPRVRDLIDEGKCGSFGVASSKEDPFVGESQLRWIVKQAADAGMAAMLTAIRSRFNVFEASFGLPQDGFASSMTQLAHDRGYTVYGDHALLADTADRFTSFVSRSAEHVDADSLMKSLKFAIDTVIYLEKEFAQEQAKMDRLAASGTDTSTVVANRISNSDQMDLRWGHIIASNQDHLMNHYRWNRALRLQIRPDLAESVDKYRSTFPNWIERYNSSMERLISKFSQAVDQSTAHEMDDVERVIEECCPDLSTDVTIEQKCISILASAGADVLFSPGETIDLRDVHRIDMDRARRTLSSISEYPFYFLER